MNPRTHDMGAYIAGVTLIPPRIFTSTNDNSEVNGLTINRNSETDTYNRSAKVVFNYASLSLAGTCTVLLNLQTSETSTAWTDYDAKDGSTGVSVVLSTASAAQGVIQKDFDIGAANQYLRLQYKVTFSSTGTVGVAGTGVFGGPPVLPNAGGAVS